MTSRERWIVYPLLFLTLGIALRGKLGAQKRLDAVQVKAGQIEAGQITAFEEIAARKIRCNELEVMHGRLAVTRRDGTDAVRMHVLPGGGSRLELCGVGGSNLVVAGTDAGGKVGLIETLNAKGQPQVRISSTRSGGVVSTVRNDRKVWLILGYEGPHYGVFAESPELERSVLLTLPLRLDAHRPPQSPPPKTPSKAESSDGGGEEREGRREKGEEGGGEPMDGDPEA